MKYLTKVVETYRLPNIDAAETFLKELREEKIFEIAKYSMTQKTKKAKGEIIDEWVRFEVTKLFNDESEPDSIIDITYDKENTFSPYLIEEEGEEE
jgi:hypothetical protein